MSTHRLRTGIISAHLLAGISLGAMALIMSAPEARAQQPAAPPSGGAAAHATPTPAGDDQALFIGAISADDVYVRSGSGESYYPFFKVRRGDLVKITGEKYGFLRVAIVGPAFHDAYGYVKDTKAVRLAADGRSALTLGRVDVFAPNLDGNGQPKDSWKTLLRVEPDQTLDVIETVNDAVAGTVYKVALPAGTTGWISSQFAPHASAEDAELFKQVLEGKVAANTPAKQDKPATNAKSNTPPANAQAGNSNTPANTNGNPNPNANAANTGAAQPTVSAPPTDQNQPGATTTTPPASLGDASAAAGAGAASQPEKPHDPTLPDLETAFKQLQKEPIETAEVMPLRDLYMALADRNPKDQKIQRYAQTRAQQLEIWQKLQQKKQEVADAQTRMKMSADEADAVRAALERSKEYVAVGRVAASTIYDGVSLPKLFRLQDPATGRTIAYLKPDTDYVLANRVDIIVGIVGDKTYDESLRLNVITPHRVDVLAPDQKTVQQQGVAGATEHEDK